MAVFSRNNNKYHHFIKAFIMASQMVAFGQHIHKNANHIRIITTIPCNLIT